MLRKATFSRQLGDVLAYIEKLKQADVSGVEPTAHAFDVVQENGRVRRVEPPLRRDPCDGQRLEVGPLALEFAGGRVTVGRPGQPRVSAAVTDVAAVPFHAPLPSMQRLCTMGAGT